MKLICQAAIQIQKPVNEVFENSVNPDKMTNYFIGTSSGRMENGVTLIWTFPEFDEKCPVSDIRLISEQLIEFKWDVGTVVRIELKEQPDKSTLVRVTEDGRDNDEAGLKWFSGNTEGWANFLACLKAFSEYGINLRKGAFDYLKQP